MVLVTVPVASTPNHMLSEDRRRIPHRPGGRVASASVDRQFQSALLGKVMLAKTKIAFIREQYVQNTLDYEGIQTAPGTVPGECSKQK